jgi:hypothetical protein
MLSAQNSVILLAIDSDFIVSIVASVIGTMAAIGFSVAFPDSMIALAFLGNDKKIYATRMSACWGKRNSSGRQQRLSDAVFTPMSSSVGNHRSDRWTRDKRSRA